VIDLSGPARTAIVDASDGSLRTVRVREEPMPPPPRSWLAPMPRVPSADVSGLVVLLAAASRATVHAVDSTTGALAWTRSADAVMPPLLDAGALVAWAVQPEQI